MPKQIMRFALESEMKIGKIVIAEYEAGGVMTRGIVHAILTKKRVQVLHGSVSPICFYSFDNARKAQEFINEIQK